MKVYILRLFSQTLNPLDFSIFSVCESKVQMTSHHTVKSLQNSIKREWRALPCIFKRRVCARFLPRLEDAIAADGGFMA